MRNCREHFLAGLVVSLVAAAVVGGVSWFVVTPTVAALAGAVTFLGVFFWGFIELDPKRRL